MCRDPFFDYHRQFGTDVRVARIFNTYGPRMHPNDGRVVSNFLVQAIKGDEITIYGDGSQTRSFCYVDDLIQGIYLFMSQDQEYGPINLGNPEEISINELAQTIIKITDSKSNMVYRRLAGDDPIKRKPDITKARSCIDWAPRVSLEDGLKETAKYF